MFWPMKPRLTPPMQKIDTIFMHAKHRHLIPLGFEPRTSRVLGERDNHYTMESALAFTGE